MKSKPRVLVAYVATPHSGYLKLFRSYGGILYVLGSEFVHEFPSLVRNLPSVTPEEIQKMVRALGIFEDVQILTRSNLWVVQKMHGITMPEERISHILAEKYFPNVLVIFDSFWHLRWDWGSVQKSRQPEGECTISTNELNRTLMCEALGIAQHSPDWWRQIGALLVRNGKILLSAFNRHIPNEQSAYCYGDPRSNFETGERIDVSGALHAEIGIIAEVARLGISMEGCDLYVTTFPCPPCAYAVAFTGIKRLFYVDGYSLISGAETLETNNVKIIRVVM